MPTPNDLASAGLGLAAGICLVALFLGLRQWYERRARGSDLSDEDKSHFARQDVRRRVGVAVLVVTAAVVVVGSRTQPRSAGRPSLLFVGFWTAVLGLIVVLLVLSLLDWLATRSYALRHRRQILRDSIKAMHQDARPSPPSAAPAPPEPPPPADRPDSA